MIKRVLLYGMWLLSTFGAFFLAERPQNYSILENTAITKDYVCFSNDNLNLIVDKECRIKAIELKPYNQAIVAPNNKSVFNIVYKSEAWKLVKKTTKYLMYSSNNINRYIKLDGCKVQIVDQFKSKADSINRTISFTTTPNDNNYLLIENKLIRNDHKVPWFAKASPVKSSSLINNPEAYMGVVSKNLATITNPLQPGQVVSSTTDAYSTELTNTSNSELQKGSIAYDFSINSIEALNKIKYNDTWFTFIPKVIDFVLTKCQSLLPNPFISFIGFIGVILAVFMPLFFMEYKKRKAAAEMDMQELPQESSAIDFVLNLLFGLMMYYITVWVIPMNVVLNNVPFLWFNSINSIEGVNILNWFGHLDIQLPKLLRFGPISIAYAYGLMNNMLNIKLKGYWQVAVFYTLLMLSSNLIPLSVMLVVSCLVILKNMIINFLVRYNTPNDNNIIRIS